MTRQEISTLAGLVEDLGLIIRDLDTLPAITEPAKSSLNTAKNIIHAARVELVNFAGHVCASHTIPMMPGPAPAPGPQLQ